MGWITDYAGEIGRLFGVIVLKSMYECLLVSAIDKYVVLFHVKHGNMAGIITAADKYG